MEAALKVVYEAVTKVTNLNKREPEKMDLSVVIVNWNVKELLSKQLETIFFYTKDINFEIIVVDNESKDGSVTHLRQKFKEQILDKRLKIIANDFNAGFAKANNQGYKIATGEYILFMNPDMLMTNNSFKKMHDLMKNRPEVGIATCRLLYGDKTTQPNVKKFPTLCSQILVLLKMHHFFSWTPCLKKYLMKDFSYTSEKEVDQVMGAFLFTRKRIMDKIGAWDEDYWLWWEDMEMCKRVKDLGHKIIFAPVTEVIHFEGKSFAQTFGLTKQKRFNKGMLIYFKKHHSKTAYYTLWALQPISWALTLLTQLFKIKARPQSRV